MEVKLSKGLFARQRRERERRERNKGYGINELLSNKSDTVNVLASYKIMPEILPFFGVKRRISRSCKECVNANREGEFKSDDDSELGMGNCFFLSNRNRPMSRRVFDEIFHYWDRGGQARLYKFVGADDVLNYAKFQEMQNIINQEEGSKLNGDKPNDIDEFIKGSDSKASIIHCKDNLILEEFVQLFGLKQMKTWVQRLLLRFGGWLLGKIFKLAFDGVCYHKGTLKLLKTASESGLPIIYVPLNKSELDSILLPWLLLSQGISPLPVVVEPRALASASFFVRTFATLFGGIGIQKIDNKSSGYNQLTNLGAFSYLRLLLLKGNSLQFDIEPYRSRNGKQSSFLAGSGILSTIVGMFKNKELEDAFIVPVSIGYEKLPELGMVECAQVEPSKCGNAGIVSLGKLLLGGSLGFARIDFSQPIRLRDFRYKQPYSTLGVGDRPVFPVDTRCAYVMPQRELQFNDDVASLSSVYGGKDPFQNPDDDTEDDFTATLAQHVLYDAQKAATFMSTHLLSFLLLKKFRFGTSVDNLIREMVELRADIYSRKRDVGFTGDIQGVVFRAIHLLGDEIISTSRDKSGQIWVKPVGTTKSSLVLGYYAGPLVQLYIREACVSTAILSIAGLTYKAMLNTSFPMTTSEEQLFRNSLEVAQLMKGEFILNPPCESTDAVVRGTISSMGDYGYIYIHKKKEYVNTHGFADSDEYDDEDQYDDGSLDLRAFAARSDVTVRVEKIEFINKEETWKYHEFLRSLVVPYLEFYTVGLKVLQKLGAGVDQVQTVKEELELREEILFEAKKLLETKLFRAEEIMIVDSARNFLYHMQSMGVIGSLMDEKTNGKRMIYLMDEYKVEPRKLQVIIACVMKHITY